MSTDTSQEINKLSNTPPPFGPLTQADANRLDNAIWEGLGEVQGLADRDRQTGLITGELSVDIVNDILTNVCVTANMSFERLPESLQSVRSAARAARNSNALAEAKNAAEAEKEGSTVVHAVIGISTPGLILAFADAIYEPYMSDFDSPSTLGE